MARRRSLSAVVLLLAALAGGCGTGPEKRTANKPVIEPAAEPAAETPAETPAPEKDDAGATRRSLHDSLAARLEKLEMELSGLREKVASFPEAARKEWLDAVSALDAEAHAARERLGELGRATHDAWDGLRDDASAAWERLEAAVKQALSDAEGAGSEEQPVPQPTEPADA